MPGSKPGERRGGRKKGTPNKATADVRAAAQAYSDDALKTLASIMRSTKQPAAARVSAATAILDRAHGKPTQAIVASGPDGGPIQHDTAGAFAALPKEKREAVRAALKAAFAA